MAIIWIYDIHVTRRNKIREQKSLTVDCNGTLQLQSKGIAIAIIGFQVLQ
jgi:hypothetical protein